MLKCKICNKVIENNLIILEEHLKEHNGFNELILEKDYSEEILSFYDSF